MKKIKKFKFFNPENLEYWYNSFWLEWKSRNKPTKILIKELKKKPWINKHIIKIPNIHINFEKSPKKDTFQSKDENKSIEKIFIKKLPFPKNPKF